MIGLEDLVLLPLRASVICIGCETVSNAKGDTCPACGTGPLVSLGKVMNRELEDEFQRDGLPESEIARLP